MSRSSGVPLLMRMVVKGAAVLLGGIFAVSVVSSTAVQYAALVKKQKGMKCDVCKGIGYYKCKLCNGNSTIQWSPLYDPVVINPCLCPTCDGNKVQKCLNCLGLGYT
ncbi:unnamed protein product [Ilex paraguariensis]|uniref:Uncharacterized protein n=1 Tax=Ilex paraguariensis TaxID=185542 RepID=A0ABC8QMT9_9AQUA